MVDDEEFILDTVELILEKSGYKVTTCKNGSEVIQMYKDNWKDIDLVIIDMIMPVMNGKETFNKMKIINPNVLALLSSGYSIDGEAQKILDEGVKGFLAKPYRRADLIQTIADLLHENRV